MFQWFDVKEVVLQATQTAEEILKVFPVEGSPLSSRKNKKKSATHFDKTLAAASGYISDKNLNVYKKAKFINTIRWTLLDAGHDKAFCEDIIQNILAGIRKGSR